MLKNTYSAGFKWMELDSFQLCSAIDQGAVDTHWNTESSIQT